MPHTQLKELIDRGNNTQAIEKYFKEHPEAINEPVDDEGNTPIIYAWKENPRIGNVISAESILQHFNYEKNVEVFAKTKIDDVSRSLEIYILKIYKSLFHFEFQNILPQEYCDYLSGGVLINLYYAAKLKNPVVEKLLNKESLLKKYPKAIIEVINALLSGKKPLSNHAAKGLYYLYGLNNYPVNSDLAITQLEQAKIHSLLVVAYFKLYQHDPDLNYNFGIKALKAAYDAKSVADISIIIAFGKKQPWIVRQGCFYLIDLMKTSDFPTLERRVLKIFEFILPSFNDTALFKEVLDKFLHWKSSPTKIISQLFLLFIKSFAKDSLQANLVEDTMIAFYEASQQPSLDILEAHIQIYKNKNPEKQTAESNAKLAQLEVQRGKLLKTKGDYANAKFAFENASAIDKSSLPDLIECLAENAQYAQTHQIISTYLEANDNSQLILESLSKCIDKILKFFPSRHAMRTKFIKLKDKISLKIKYQQTILNLDPEKPLDKLSVLVYQRDKLKYLGILQCFHPNIEKHLLDKSEIELLTERHEKVNYALLMVETLRDHHAAKNIFNKYAQLVFEYINELSVNDVNCHKQIIILNLCAMLADSVGVFHNKVLTKIQSMAEISSDELISFLHTHSLLEAAREHNAKKQVRRSVTLYGLVLLQAKLDIKTDNKAYQFELGERYIFLTASETYLSSIRSSSNSYSEYAAQWLQLIAVIEKNNEFPFFEVLEKHHLISVISHFSCLLFSDAFEKNFMMGTAEAFKPSLVKLQKRILSHHTNLHLIKNLFLLSCFADVKSIYTQWNEVIDLNEFKAPDAGPAAGLALLAEKAIEVAPAAASSSAAVASVVSVDEPRLTPVAPNSNILITSLLDFFAPVVQAPISEQKETIEEDAIDLVTMFGDEKATSTSNTTPVANEPPYRHCERSAASPSLRAQRGNPAFLLCNFAAKTLDCRAALAMTTEVDSSIALTPVTASSRASTGAVDSVYPNLANPSSTITPSAAAASAAPASSEKESESDENFIAELMRRDKLLDMKPVLTQPTSSVSVDTAVAEKRTLLFG